jgi:ATP-dependent helicase/nuclease subunit B
MSERRLTRHELFERLAEGHVAGITVVTPNRRLAQVLRAEFDSFQAARGRSVWEDADILPLDAFAGRCYEDALYADGGERLPTLLSAAQARELWQEAIAGSRWKDDLRDVPGTAARAMASWRLALAWNIHGGLQPFAATEDAQVFVEWATAYARRLKKDRLVDAALLPSLGLTAPRTKLLVAYAFDILTPQAREVLSRHEVAFCAAETKNPAPVRISHASPREELETAARWARARLEAGKARIGVVVPDLERRRREVARVFARVMGSSAPFNLSIGQPLADYPVVAAALSLLEFSLGEIPFEQASRLIRSPFLGGAEREMAARAAFDAALRRKADGTIALPKLIGAVPPNFALRTYLERLFNVKSEDQSPFGWARRTTALLEAAGYPGERALDSAEYQARAKFNEVLGEFSGLSLVVSRITATNAFANLRRLCAETLFQPEAAAGEMRAPVQVLGRLESAGIGFDALWVSGMTEGAWPLHARPDPFLPVGLQKKAGIPEAAAETSLALDRRVTAGWAHAADEVVFSWPRREEDRDQLPSPLIAEFPEGKAVVPSFVNYRDSLFDSRAVEQFEDEKAPELEDKTVRGGTRVLANQAACPFRAFARHRLAAEQLKAPQLGLDASDRGRLLHAFMANVWQQLGGSAALAGDLEPALEKAARAAVAELELEGRFAELEAGRLQRLGRDWLAVEARRAPFEVAHVEQERELEVAGLAFKGRIDRMDKLEDGTHAVIDYKTGRRVTPKDWDGPRPDDPQLPLYAVTAKETVSVVAFGKLRAGDMKFSGFSARKGVIPNVRPALNWDALRAGWRAALEELARGFAAGKAGVDPKEGLYKTCRYCDLHTLCRVHERLSALDEEEEGEE